VQASIGCWEAWIPGVSTAVCACLHGRGGLVQQAEEFAAIPWGCRSAGQVGHYRRTGGDFGWQQGASAGSLCASLVVGGKCGWQQGVCAGSTLRWWEAAVLLCRPPHTQRDDASSMHTKVGAPRGVCRAGTQHLRSGLQPGLVNCWGAGRAGVESAAAPCSV
jgi:hypothetical protein